MIAPQMEVSTPKPPPGSIVVGAHRLRFLRDGAVAFPAMLAAIEGAKREVLLEIYWLGADRIGARFRSALIERARAGVRVALVFDALGSFEMPRSFLAPLVEVGAEVHEFAPLSPFQPRFRVGRIRFRDHRKILVVDGEVGFAGGINIGELWAPPDEPSRAFRDDAIEIRGPAVSLLRATCLATLRHCRGLPATDAPNPNAVDPLVRVLTNRLDLHASRSIRRTYLVRLRDARRSIDISSAYLLPGPLFLHAMRLAVRRGVRVRVLVPEHSDVPLVGLAMQSILGRLLVAGVEVYAYMPRVLHTKTAVFDGRFTFIGSHNLDSLSLSRNLECNVAVDSEEFARIVLDAFEDDLTQARRMDLASWQQRSLPLRVLAWIAALFRALL